MTSLKNDLPTEVLELADIRPEQVCTVPWEDPVWLFDLDNGRVVITVKANRTEETLHWEAMLLDELERLDFACQRAARIFDGSDLADVDGVWYIARTWIPGQTLYQTDVDLAEVGRFIASYHATIEELSLPQRPGVVPLGEILPQPTDDQLSHVLGEQPLVERYRESVEQITPSLARNARMLPIHGDFNTRNIVGEGDPLRVVGLIDFGMAQVASPEMELGYGLGSAKFPRIPELNLEQVTRLIAGYSSKRRLEDGAAEAIADFRRARSLLNVASLALAEQGPSNSGVRWMEWVEWLTEHRPELVMAIERGITSSDLPIEEST